MKLIRFFFMIPRHAGEHILMSQTNAFMEFAMILIHVCAKNNGIVESIVMYLFASVSLLLLLQYVVKMENVFHTTHAIAHLINKVYWIIVQYLFAMG